MRRERPATAFYGFTDMEEVRASDWLGHGSNRRRYPSHRFSRPRHGILKHPKGPEVHRNDGHHPSQPPFVRSNLHPPASVPFIPPDFSCSPYGTRSGLDSHPRSATSTQLGNLNTEITIDYGVCGPDRCSMSQI